eukprot:1274459-Pyramimonas_sp.AAC.1
MLARASWSVASVMAPDLRSHFVAYNIFLQHMAATKKGYRKSVDIAYDAACLAFDELPPIAFTSPRLMYPEKAFKNAPKWSKGVKLIPTLKIILDASDGQAVHQKDLLKHLASWIEERGHDPAKVENDVVIFGLRALL